MQMWIPIKFTNSYRNTISIPTLSENKGRYTSYFILQGNITLITKVDKRCYRKGKLYSKITHEHRQKKSSTKTYQIKSGNI